MLEDIFGVSASYVREFSRIYATSERSIIFWPELRISVVEIFNEVWNLYIIQVQDISVIELKISDMEKDKNNATSFIIPTISALKHIPTLVLSNEEEINFWQT